MRDRDVVDAFVAHLRSTGHPDLQVEWHPDKENRGSPDIDAIAGSFAIEHTSVDRLPDQRMHADWFHRVVGGLEAEVLHQLPFRLIVTFDHGAIGKNQNWRRIRQALKSWVLDEAGHLPDGTHHLDVPGVPFRLHVTKASRRPAKLGFRLWQPEDTTFPGRIRELLEAKARKLAPYRAAELITVLLVESDDIRLFDEEELVEAIRGAFPEGRPPGVDQVWYADTSIPSECEFKELK